MCVFVIQGFTGKAGKDGPQGPVGMYVSDASAGRTEQRINEESTITTVSQQILITSLMHHPVMICYTLKRLVVTQVKHICEKERESRCVALYDMSHVAFGILEINNYSHESIDARYVMKVHSDGSIS